MIDFKLGGYFLTAAGLLLVTRLIPIMTNIPDGFAGFPPTSMEQLALLINHNPFGHKLSHQMALLAMPLIWIGMFAHYQQYIEMGFARRAIIGITAITAHVIFFSIALVIDGYMLTDIAQEIAEPKLLDRSTASFLLNHTHESALAFFKLSSLCLMIGIGFLSLPIAHGYIHNKWFGYVGIIIAVVGASAQSLELPALMLSYIWLFALGLSTIKASKAD